MPAFEHKKSTSRGRAASPPVPQRHTLPQSACPIVQRAHSCSCGGSCPRCRNKKMAPLQAKLNVSQPGDALEREADQVAEQVLRMPQPGASVETSDAAPRISRLSESGQASSEASAAVHDTLRESGQSLDTATRAYFEPRFGRSFDDVRVHTGAAAADSAYALGAKAYTVGRHMAFSAGQYAPETAVGKRLLAHELAHVVQQRGIRHHGSAGVIQREVEPEHVSSSDEVVTRIQANVSAADTAFAPLAPGLRLYDSQLANDLSNLLRLLYQAHSFNPGASLESNNAFVYTCDGGWIDLGHFYLSATLGYLFGYGPAMTAGWAMEAIYQAILYRIARRLDPGDLDPEVIEEDIFSALGAGVEFGLQVGALVGGAAGFLVDRPLYGAAVGAATGGGIFSALALFDPSSLRELITGNARSYFTIEDLPSDHFGSLEGAAMGGQPERLHSLPARMELFFRAKRARYPFGEVLEQMLEETAPNGIPRQNYTTEPVLLPSAAPLCE